MIGLAEFQISNLLASASARQSYARRANKESDDGVKRGGLNARLVELIDGLDGSRRKLSPEGQVTCLITDSRRVVPGALFFAISGRRTDGNHYIEEAVDRGAVAIVTEQELGRRFPIDYVKVPDVRRSLAEVAKRFYQHPDEALHISGITGTNGKTTVSMLAQHLTGGRDEVGLIGTIRYDLGRRTLPSFRTTPESVDVFALLSQMRENGCAEAVMEISSHGIDQKRVDGLDVDVAAFLNLTQDHIDYHGTMEAYYQVKRRLFTGGIGTRPKTAVVNTDCPYGRRLAEEIAGTTELITVGTEGSPTFRADEILLRPDCTEFVLKGPTGRSKVVSPLLGRYNVNNLLAAIGIGHAKGRDITEMAARLASFPAVPGRMERIACGQDYNVLVDYAHTDDALRHACEMLREVTKSRLIVVFGCGGDRDRTKRVPMVRAVLERADCVFATADNPRSESLSQIFDDMRVGAESAGAALSFIEDRKRAISLALDEAKAGDCILIAGKGHESYQEFDGTVIPFDDRQVARELIEMKHPDLGRA